MTRSTGDGTRTAPDTDVSTAIRQFVSAASFVTMAFGVWHFFVPGLWRWYSYIDPAATELLRAVRALNVLFSLSLVLCGAVNVLLVVSRRPDRYSISVVLGASCVLWATRVVLQVVYPQGSLSFALQYGMLAVFVGVTACYATALFLVVRKD